MFGLAFNTELESKYNIIKDVTSGQFTSLASDLNNHIDAFDSGMGNLFNSSSSWACSTKDSADNSVASIKSAISTIKPSVELIRQVGPLVDTAKGKIEEYIKAYNDYTRVKNSPPPEKIEFTDDSGNTSWKDNPEYNSWLNIDLSVAYNAASNLENESLNSLNNISACLSGGETSIVPSSQTVSFNLNRHEINESLSDGNTKKGYKILDVDGKTLREDFYIIDSDGVVVQHSIINYDNENNTRSEEYTCNYSDGATKSGIIWYEEEMITNETYTFYNSDGVPTRSGTILYNNEDNTKRDVYTLYDANGEVIGFKEELYDENGKLIEKPDLSQGGDELGR